MASKVEEGVALFTPEEVAEATRYSVRSVNEWIRSGELPAVRVGSHGHWRVRATDLRSFINGMNSNQDPAA